MEFLKIWEILIRRKATIIIVFLLFFATIAIMTNVLTPIYEGKAIVLVETSDTLTSLMSTLELQDIKAGMATSSDDGYETEIALAKIKPLLKELISQLELKNRDGEVLDSKDLVKGGLTSMFLPKPHLEVNRYEDAAMLEIISNSTDPSEAANMSNTLAKLYIEDALERNREEYRASRIFIENQIQRVKQEYFKALASIKEFMIKEGTVDLDFETKNLIDKILNLKNIFEDNEKAIMELESKLAKINEQLKDISKFRKESEQYTQSDQIKQLKSRLNDLLITISGKSVDIHKEHPDFKQLEKEIDIAKEIIKGEEKVVFNSEKLSIDPLYEDLKKRLVDSYINQETAFVKREIYKNYIDEYQTQLLQMPLKIAENSKLQLELSLKKDMYQKLLKYTLQAGIAESITLSNIRLIENAEVPDEDDPDFPEKTLNYVLGIVLGLFWGLSIAFFKEYIDNTVKSPEDIKTIELLTYLGTIPKIKELKKNKIISKCEPTSPVVESFRTIKNSTLYASVDKQLKTISFTSSIDNEGKSSLASNISIIFTMEGRKVLLVGLNLRKPSLNNFFNIPYNQGVTDVLSGSIRLEEAIINSDIKGLDLLTSGPIPLDPSRLIESQKLKDLIQTLENMYDIVIIDTPPVIPVNDAIVIGNYTDATIFVMESSKVTFSMVKHATELMDKAGLNIIGVILNKFKAQYSGYGNYYYRQYYKN